MLKSFSCVVVLAALLTSVPGCRLLESKTAKNPVSKPAGTANPVGSTYTAATTASNTTPNTRTIPGTNKPTSLGATRSKPNKPGPQASEAPLLLSIAPAQLLPDPNAPQPSATPATIRQAVPESKIATPARALLPEPTLPPIPAAPGESANPPADFLLPSSLFAPASAPTPASAAPAPAVASTALAAPVPAPTPANSAVGNAPDSAKASASTVAASAQPTTAPANNPPTPPNATPVARIVYADQITNKLVRTKLPPVYLYASPTSRQYLAAGGINYQNNLDVWQYHLKRHDIPYEVINSMEQLDPRGTLILPSSIALNPLEKRSIAQYQQQGGNLLATWLCGVRDENGAWLGFQFMQQVFQTNVVGSTEADNDDSFLLPYGAAPISHQLPAGLRVWTERVPNWYPLRLTSANLAAQITDWSRNVNPKKRAGLISYAQLPGKAARSVVLGFPERLWFSADPVAFNALASDALMWLLHQPAAYLANWPQAYRSAMVLSVNASDYNEEADNAFALQTESLGWHASYYALSERLDVGKPLLKKLQARGHEIAYFGDKLIGFQNQSGNQQGKRLDSMINEFKDAELEVTEPPGFRAPLDSMDATTLRLLRQKGMNHVITDQGASESRLPFFSAPFAGAKGEAMVMLPRTLSAPEDLLSDNPPAIATQNTIYELELADEMGALGVLTIPTRTSITPANWGAMLNALKARKQHIWLASPNQVASWWREHERVKVSFDADVTPPLLTVEVSGDGPLQQAPVVLVNLPQSGQLPQLTADGHGAPAPKVSQYDQWRAALQLPNLAPGTYHWYLSF